MDFPPLFSVSSGTYKTLKSTQVVGSDPDNDETSTPIDASGSSPSYTPASAPETAGVTDSEGEFWEIIEQAEIENKKYMQNIPWPPPPHLDPFNFLGSVRAGHTFTAESQWEIMKEFARQEGARTQPAKPMISATCEAPLPCSDKERGGCTSISAEPNTQTKTPRCATLPKGMTPVRFGIDQVNEYSASPGFVQAMQTLIMEEIDGYGNVGEIMIADWVDVELDITLDSGCCDHVMDTEQCAPGYEVFESEGSKQAAGFRVGNGERIPNEGEVHLNLSAPGTKGAFSSIGSTFQAAPVTRPLMSVSKICKNGFKCIFDENEA